uniref:Col_cuticle_N domain-containing protein n=1 Tax=Ascaris lumbricoides TaxID=6252 RepID=A0A0M3IWY8_ASCLU
MGRLAFVYALLLATIVMVCLATSGLQKLKESEVQTVIMSSISTMKFSYPLPNMHAQ